jgi:hypothetical protein
MTDVLAWCSPVFLRQIIIYYPIHGYPSFLLAIFEAYLTHEILFTSLSLLSEGSIHITNNERGCTAMKKLCVFTGILAIFLLTLTLTDNAFSKSSENRAACIKWCNNNKQVCEKCHSNTTCGGRSWKVIKSFKKGTGNWYACGLTDYGRGSRKNRKACQRWCIDNPDKCDFCWKNSDCQSGLQKTGERIKTFRGRGENYYACRLTARGLLTEERLEACRKMCKSSEICDFCTTGVCGAGYDVVARFRGKGLTVRACKKR